MATGQIVSGLAEDWNAAEDRFCLWRSRAAIQGITVMSSMQTVRLSRFRLADDHIFAQIRKIEQNFACIRYCRLLY